MWSWRCTKAKWNLGLGTCQERPDWGERHSSYQQWQASYGDMAGYMVSRVQRRKALKEGCGDDSGREDMRVCNYVLIELFERLGLR